MRRSAGLTTPRDQYVLAIDLGTSARKAALVSTAGAIAGWEFAAVDTVLLPHGGAEQDPRAWWNAFLCVAKKLIGQGLVAPRQIAAICCST